MRALGWIPLLGLLLPAIAVAQAPADSTEVERIRALVREDPARAAARAETLVQRLDTPNRSDLELAEALDLWVEAQGRAQGGSGWLAARESAERAVALRERHPDVDPLARATSYRALGLVHYIAGENREAIRYWESCLEIREAELGLGHEDTGQILYNLASVTKAAGDLDASADYNRRALETYLVTYGPEHRTVAVVLNQRANLVHTRGDLEGAAEDYRRALAIEEAADRLGGRFSDGIRGNLAAVLVDLGRFDEAQQLLETSLQRNLARDPVDQDDVLTLWQGLGRVHFDKAELGPARDCYQAALELARSNYGEEHFLVAHAYNNLALVAGAMGDTGLERQLYERALAIKEEFAEERAWDLALALSNLGSLYLGSGDTELGRPMLERALSIRREVYGPRHALVATTLNHLGELWLREGDRSKARPVIEEALQIREEVHGPTHRRIVESLLTTTRLELAEGNLEAAVSNVERGIAVAVEVVGEDHPLTAEARALRAVLLERRGDLDAARREALLAERVGAAHLRLSIQAFSERSALAYAATRPRGLGMAAGWSDASTPAPSVAAMWDALVRNRALVLEEMMERRALRARGGAEELALFDDLAAASTRLANFVVGGGEEAPEAYALQVARARREKEKLELQIAERSRRYREKKRRDEVGFEAIQRALPAEDVLVAYLRSGIPTSAFGEPDESYVAFVLESGQPPRLVPLGPAGPIEARLARWRSEVEQGALIPGRSATEAEAACRRAGERLRSAVVDPLGLDWDRPGRLLVVPDGALHLLNLAALPSSSGGYLVERARLVQILHSERDLVRTSPMARGEGMLVVGGADYDRADSMPEAIAPARIEGPGSEGAGLRGALASCPQFAALRFAKLPASAEEVRAIAETPGTQFRVLAGAGATERAFKAESPGHRVLHLATHAFFLGDICAVPASVAVPGLPMLSIAGDSPLLLSGLALAGANRRSETGEDGILTAEEIAALDLAGVELAVLSACATAEGLVRDREGVLGLGRAFRVAGAQTLVLSQWRVEDRWTRDFMAAFYRGLQDGNATTPAAVRAASRAMLERARQRNVGGHPFYWGGFVSVGMAR